MQVLNKVYQNILNVFRQSIFSLKKCIGRMFFVILLMSVWALSLPLCISDLLLDKRCPFTVCTGYNMSVC